MNLLYPLLVALLLAPLHASKPSLPNVLIILADDLGYGDVAC